MWGRSVLLAWLGHSTREWQTALRRAAQRVLRARPPIPWATLASKCQGAQPTRRDPGVLLRCRTSLNPLSDQGWLPIASGNLLGMARPGQAVLQEARPPPWTLSLSYLSDAEMIQANQGPAVSRPGQTGAAWTEGRLGPHTSLASSPSTAIRRLSGWPSVAVAAAAQGLPEPHCSGQLWAMGHVGAGS